MRRTRRSPPHLRLMGQVGLFLCVPLAGFIPFELAWWKAGETWPVERALAVQRQLPAALFLREHFDQQIYRYKLLGTQGSHPQILALGSSRANAFRREMFGEDGRGFYNAGGLIQNLGDLETALALLPNVKPRVLLLGVDSWWLNPNYTTARSLARDAYGDAAYSPEGHLMAFRDQLHSPREAISLLLHPRPPLRVGCTALRQARGFRSDGSYKHGVRAPTTNATWKYLDRVPRGTLTMIRRGADQFPNAVTMSDAKLQRFRRVLETWKQRGTLVVGFLPPVHGGAEPLLETLPEQRGFWADYRKRVPELFAELGMPCVDASTPQRLGLNDHYMRDGTHAAETYHLCLLQRMLQDPRVARALPTAHVGLKRALASPRTNAWYPDFEGTADERLPGG